MTLPPVTPAQEAWLLAGADSGDSVVDAATVVVPDDESFLALTPEMKRFAEEAVRRVRGEEARVRALLRAVLSPRHLGLKYDETATYGAADAFRHTRANCLGFTALFVAMARHVGLDAHFNEVDIPPVWNLHGEDTLVLYRHINALVRVRGGASVVVDADLDVYDASYPQRKISDRLARAQHYNNLAMRLLIENDLVAARRHLAKAISIDPGVSYLWSNLGAAYSRTGHKAAAQLAFVKAIRMEPSDHAAVSNAARLFAELGQQAIAERLERQAARHRKRNPYYRYRQGLVALADGQYASAKGHAHAAIRLHESEHRFHSLLAAAYRGLGDIVRARRSLDRAIELASDSEQAARYRQEMEMLGARDP